MKVTAVNGSARKDGNTDLMIRTVFRELEKEGIETECISLAGRMIEPCKACWAWNMGYGQLPGDVLNDAEAMANMCNLGHNMAFLLKAVCREAI